MKATLLYIYGKGKHNTNIINMYCLHLKDGTTIIAPSIPSDFRLISTRNDDGEYVHVYEQIHHEEEYDIMASVVFNPDRVAFTVNACDRQDTDREFIPNVSGDWTRKDILLHLLRRTYVINEEWEEKIARYAYTPWVDGEFITITIPESPPPSQ